MNRLELNLHDFLNAYFDPTWALTAVGVILVWGLGVAVLMLFLKGGK